MERDFVGLKWKDSCETVKEKNKLYQKRKKEKNKDICSDSVNELQWPFSKKVSSPSQFMPCKAALENIGRKNIHDSITSPVFSPILSGYAVDCNSKPPPIKKNFNRTWMFPFTEETGSVGSSNPLYNTYTTNAGGQVFSAPMNNKSFGGISVMEQSSISPTFNIMNGTSDHLRNQINPSRAPAQLTIFYGNTVYCFDDVTPEKVKAIMRLAEKPVAEDIPSYQAQPPVIVHSLQSSTATYREGTVPQARKASLDRFLERRKDRLNIRMPYSIMKESNCSGIQLLTDIP